MCRACGRPSAGWACGWARLWRDDVEHARLKRRASGRARSSRRRAAPRRRTRPPPPPPPPPRMTTRSPRPGPNRRHKRTARTAGTPATAETAPTRTTTRTGPSAPASCARATCHGLPVSTARRRNRRAQIPSGGAGQGTRAVRWLVSRSRRDGACRDGACSTRNGACCLAWRRAGSRGRGLGCGGWVRGGADGLACARAAGLWRVASWLLEDWGVEGGGCRA